MLLVYRVSHTTLFVGTATTNKISKQSSSKQIFCQDTWLHRCSLILTDVQQHSARTRLWTNAWLKDIAVLAKKTKSYTIHVLACGDNSSVRTMIIILSSSTRPKRPHTISMTVRVFMSRSVRLCVSPGTVIRG